MAKSTDQVSSELIALIDANFAPTPIDTRIGTVLRDAIITPVATEISQAYTDLDTVSSNQSILNAATMSDENMDGLAANFGISRFLGSPAVGIVRFFKITAPASPITIPALTKISTDPTNAAESATYRTLSSVVLTNLSSPDTYKGAASSVDVAAVCETNGPGGNADFDTIRNVLVPLTGVDGVYNPAPFSGGKDTQTNEELAELIRAKAQGGTGTKSGYISAVKQNFSVSDVVVVGPNDPEANRSQFGGGTDIVVLYSQTVQAVESFSYAGPSTTILQPTFRPLVSVGSITGIDSLTNPITLSGPPNGVGNGLDYDVVLDTSGPNAGSYIDNSRIVLHPTANIPGNGTMLTVTYQENQMVRIIQSFFALDENNILGSDVLVKSGVEVRAVVTADVKVIPGFDPPTVQAAVEAAAQAYFNALLLGQSADAASVVAAMDGVEGVAEVILSTFILAYENTPLVPEDEITASKYDFVRATSVTVNLV